MFITPASTPARRVLVRKLRPKDLIKVTDSGRLLGRMPRELPPALAELTAETIPFRPL